MTSLQLPELRRHPIETFHDLRSEKVGIRGRMSGRWKRVVVLVELVRHGPAIIEEPAEATKAGIHGFHELRNTVKAGLARFCDL